jgi:hypothetical protein
MLFERGRRAPCSRRKQTAGEACHGDRRELVGIDRAQYLIIFRKKSPKDHFDFRKRDKRYERPCTLPRASLRNPSRNTRWRCQKCTSRRRRSQRRHHVCPCQRNVRHCLNAREYGARSRSGSRRGCVPQAEGSPQQPDPTNRMSSRRIARRFNKDVTSATT